MCVLKMRFSIPATNCVQLSVAAAHGAADAARPPEQLAIYAIALLPIPPAATTASFAVASVIHFAADVGLAASVGLHLIVAAVSTFSFKFAMRIMLAYISYAHVPILAFNLVSRRRMFALLCMCIAIAVCVMSRIPCGTSSELYELGHKQQLVVVAHVVLSLIFP